MTYRETLEGLLARNPNEKNRKRYEAGLAVPPFPDALNYLWRIFLRLSRRRGSNGFGPSPLSWRDFDAFTRLTGMRLAPWEIEVIEELDDLWLRAR